MMKKEIKIDPLLEEALSAYEVDFKPFFSTRVMAKIDRINERITVDGIYDVFFKRLMVSGVVAIAAMLVVTLLVNGSLSVDGLLGIEDLGLEKAIAMSITDYK